MSTVTDALLSIVVPLYNEEDNVVLLTEKIHKSLSGYNYQIIYIDDFSTDNTRSIAKGMNDDKGTPHRTQKELRTEFGACSGHRLRRG